MFDRFSMFLAARPKKAAAVVITLSIALILVTAGLALELTHFGRAPYPSDDIIPMKFVDGKIVYTCDSTIAFPNETPAESFPYAGMKILFQIAYVNGAMTMPIADFGNHTLLGAGSRATVHQVLVSSTWANVSIDITDITGDGSFDKGDTMTFDILPLEEKFVFTVGLLWVSPEHGNAMAFEASFTVHDGKLYAWFSDALDSRPWYEPYT